MVSLIQEFVYLGNFHWQDSEAHVVSSARSLEDPHTPFIKLAGMFYVLECGEPWEVDVQLDIWAQTFNQSLVLNSKWWGGKLGAPM